MQAFAGEIAALSTAILWSGTAIFFTLAGRQVGSVIVNRTRLLVALALLVGTHWALEGQLLPLATEPDRWIWLGLSGVVGLVLGDSFLFQAYLWVGPRLGMLMMSLAPVLAALLAWLILGETLTGLQWLGIVVAVSGIGLVVLDRRRPNVRGAQSRDYRRGILFGVGAAAGQAVGLVMAKQGLYGDFPALSGNVIRMTAAAASLWLVTLIGGRAGPTLHKLKQTRAAWLPILGGSVTGPFLGVWLSLAAIQLTEIGVASTLMALSPVFLIPLGRWVFGDRVGIQAVAGTLIAMVGVALLFLA